MNPIKPIQQKAAFIILMLLLLPFWASCRGAQPTPTAVVSSVETATAAPKPTAESSPITPLPEPLATAPAALSGQKTAVVAFVKDGNVQVWDAATNQSQTIVSTSDVDAVWLSPDGQMIAFLRRSVVEQPEAVNSWYEQSALWLVDQNGENARELVSAEALRQLLNIDGLDSSSVAQLEWLPQTDALVFSGVKYWVQGEGLSHALPEGVFVADTRALTLRVLASDSLRFETSPDGRQLALMSTTGLSFINIDGSSPQADVLTYPEVGVPLPIFPHGVWTEAGAAFYLAAPTDSDSPFALNYVIWRIPTDGSPAETIATDINDSHARSITFSPDGRFVSFIQSSGRWYIKPLSTDSSPLHLPYKIDELFWANLHWSPANTAYVIDGDTLRPLCPNAAQDSDVCGEPVNLGGTVHAIQWLDNGRFLLMTREPYALYLAHLDGTTLPIVTWLPEEWASVRNFSTVMARASEPTVSAVPLPTEAAVSVDTALQLAETSQELYEETPLLGLGLALEAWAMLPEENGAAKDKIMKMIQQMAAQARLLKLAENLGTIIPNPDQSSFLIFPEGDQGLFPGSPYEAELHLASSGQLIQAYKDYWMGDFSPNGTYFWLETSPFSTTGGSEVDLSINLYRTQDLELITTIIHPQGTSVELTFSPDETYLVVNYIGPQDFAPSAPGYLYRIADGETLQLPDRFTSIQFSADDSTYIVNYVQLPDELRYSANDQVISLGEVEPSTLNLGNTFFVVGYSDGLSEMRRVSDGTIITPLAGTIWGMFPNSNGDNFIISYTDTPGELRRAQNGEVITTLSDRLALVSFSPDGAYFTTAYFSESGTPAELRRTVDGQVVAMLDRPLNVNIFHSAFTLNGAYLAVDYIDTPSEWRRTSDFHLLFTFPGDIDQIIFSPDGAYFALSYVTGPSELRRIADGQVVTTFSCNTCLPFFSPDGAYLLQGDELWSVGDEVVLLADLGGAEPFFLNTPEAYRLVVRKGSTAFHMRAYLVNVAWLTAMAGDPAALSAAELVHILCQGPLAQDVLPESALRPFLNGRAPQACNQ